MEDRTKTIVPIKALNLLKCKVKNVQAKPKKTPWDEKIRITNYKNLNAKAKRKLRSFNKQKKILHNPSIVVPGMNSKKEDKEIKNTEVILVKTAEKIEKEKEEEVEDDEEFVENVEKDLLQTRKEKAEIVRYKEIIFRQLRDLRRENEELRQKMMQVVEAKRMEAALQEQSDNLELEKTKLKACWLVMTSTIDAFSTFCRKFTSNPKGDGKLLNIEKDENEENDDVTEDENKERRCDEKYYNFLKKLMEDQAQDEKARMHVGKR